MLDNSAKKKLRNWLVIILTFTTIIIWIYWQMNYWPTYFKNENKNANLNTQKIIKNTTEIKSEISESYQKWQQAKLDFWQILKHNPNSSTSTEINQETIDLMKEKIINQQSTTSTETYE